MKTYACNRCGTGGFRWQKMVSSRGTYGYRLVDPSSGTVHACQGSKTRVTYTAVPATHIPQAAVPNQPITTIQEPTHMTAAAAATTDALYDLIRPLVLEDIKVAAPTAAPSVITHRIEIPAVDGSSVKTVDGVRPEFATLIKLYLRARQSGMGVMLVGPAGSGKSTAGKALAETLGLPWYVQSFCRQTPISSLIGYADAHGQHVWTPFTKSITQGGVYQADEFDAANENIALTLNACVAQRALSVPGLHEGETLPVQPNWGVIATANTIGLGADRRYTGRSDLDEATRDRFLFLEWDYDHELEARLSNPDWLTYVQTARKAIIDLDLTRVTLSTRALIVGTGLLADGLDRKQMTQHVLWSKISADDASKLQAKVGLFQ